MFQTRESLLPDVSGRKQIWLILAVYRWLGSLVVAKKTCYGGVDGEVGEVVSVAAKGPGGRLWTDHMRKWWR